MSEKQIIRVLLVDDHPVVLEGMQSYLNNMAHIKVVGVACNGKEAIRKTKEIMPDVLLMDISMKGINGLEATYQIKRKYPDIKILMLSIYEDPATVHRILKTVGLQTKESTSAKPVKGDKQGDEKDRSVIGS